MEQTTFTYEAREQMLVIHLPKELDHHNCRNLKRDTDLLGNRGLLRGRTPGQADTGDGRGKPPYQRI